MLRFPDVFSKQKSLKQLSKKPEFSEASTIECSAPLSVENQAQPLTLLKQLIPLRDIDEDAISALTQTIKVYGEGATLFLRGQPAASVIYLLDGTLELFPDSPGSHLLSSETTGANLPLNSSRVFGATAVAKSRVKVIEFPVELIHYWTQQHQEDSTVFTELRDLELPDHINQNRFFTSFAQSYRENKLVLPTLPAVAMKLREAMTQEISVAVAAQIIQIDAPIVSKLIQVANSPLYSPSSPISNCHDAINRLGLEATRNLVMSISMKQLFQCQDKKLLQTIQSLWRSSLYLSSLSFVLAEESKRINPDEALLAGLVCDIGVIPLLHFAEQQVDGEVDVHELWDAIPYLKASVGTLVLHTLGFTEQLTHVPQHAEDWFYDNQAEMELIDIIILAKLHSYIGNKQAKDLPYIHSIPAYAKLDRGQLTPDFSLEVLNKAQQRINSAIKILS